MKPYPTSYILSPEEEQVIRECNADAFYQRCLPLSTVFGFLTYRGVVTGRLRPNRRYGAVPKVIAAVLVGYVLGKISFANRCAERLMRMPDSELGELLRQERRGWPDWKLALFYNIMSLKEV